MGRQYRRTLIRDKAVGQVLSDQPPPLFLNALLCRCPACGHAELFDGFLSVRKRCSFCNIDLTGHDSGDGQVPFIIFLVGAIVLGLALYVETRFAPPVWVHLIIWMPLTIVLVLGLMRPAKALMIAAQYKHRRQDFQNNDQHQD